MPESWQANYDFIDEISILYNRAREHHLYVDEENKESRNLEAFLMLATLFEGVLTSFGLILLEEREDLSALRSKRKSRYGIDNAINDLYLLGKISTQEFKELEKFKSDRNKCAHEIFRKNKEDTIEKRTAKLFEKHSITFKTIIKKFEEEEPKPSKK